MTPKFNLRGPNSQNFGNRKGTVFSRPELLWYCYFWNCSPIQCLLLKLHNLRGSNPQNFPRESLQTRQNQQNSHYKVFALRLPRTVSNIKGYTVPHLQFAPDPMNSLGRPVKDN